MKKVLTQTQDTKKPTKTVILISKVDFIPKEQWLVTPVESEEVHIQR